jgi:hypothetical protein
MGIAPIGNITTGKNHQKNRDEVYAQTLKLKADQQHKISLLPKTVTQLFDAKGVT